MAADPKFVGDLQIDSDIGHQRRVWRFERVGWVVMLLIVVAALSGAFGRGPMSQAEAASADGALRVRYQRFVRHGAPVELEIHIGPGAAAADSTARVWIDRSYIAMFDVDHLIPEPEGAEAGADRATYVFKVTDPGRPSTVSFGLVPQGYGSAPARIGVAGGPDLQLRQFIFP